MFDTGETVGLAEWIIDVLSYIYPLILLQNFLEK